MVFDACTILNLLRIDEDEFLYKIIMEQNFSIHSKVYLEAVDSVEHKPFDKDQREYIRTVLPQFGMKTKTAGEHFEAEWIPRVKSFCNGYQKENGELYSAVLSMFQSRNEGVRVVFYTDDNPARDTFLPFFTFQQIGQINDTVDLLLFLFWSIDDFELSQLKKFLQSLYSEFNTPFKQLQIQFQNNKETWLKDRPKDKSLSRYLNEVEDAYYKAQPEKLPKLFEFFNNNKGQYSKIVKVINKYPLLTSEAQLAKKVHYIISHLEKGIQVLKRSSISIIHA